jgi:ADP-ribosylglycohydrolase
LPVARDGWLFGLQDLHRRRAPGNTCLDALRRTRQIGAMAHNDSKGCGGVMRVAVCGFWPGPLAQRFQLAADCAHLTHGHVSGYLASGHLAAVIGALADGMPLPAAIAEADAILAQQRGHAETALFVTKAQDAARQGPSRETLATLGGGWVAEEALAIALYAVLAEPDPVAAMVLAVNHDGDSDSTGAIAGNILGALHGRAWLPDVWLAKLELRSEIEKLGLEFAQVVGA